MNRTAGSETRQFHWSVAVSQLLDWNADGADGRFTGLRVAPVKPRKDSAHSVSALIVGKHLSENNGNVGGRKR